MSLPDLLRYVYNHATDEVIRRGKKIFNSAGVQLMEHDALTEYITFRVKNDNYNNHYKVTIQKYIHTKELSVRCQCPYNMGSVCRHEAAALFQLNDLIQTGFFNDADIVYNQQHTTVRMRQISEHYLRLFSSQDIIKQAEQWATSSHVQIESAEDDTVKASVTDENKKVFPVILIQNEDRYFDTSCTCSDKLRPLCVHKVATFLHILYRHGANYFSTLRNWDTQKNKLLALYGYTLDDNLSGKFDFAYHEGKPFLRVLDKTIKKLSVQTTVSTTKKEEEDTIAPIADNLRLGILIHTSSNSFPLLSFDLLRGFAEDESTVFKDKIELLELFQMIPTVHLNDKERILIAALRKQSETELIRALKRNLPYGDLMDNMEAQLQESVISDEMRQLAWEFYLPKYKQLLEQYEGFPFTYYLPKGKSFSAESIVPCSFSSHQYQLQLVVKATKTTVLIDAQYVIQDQIIPAQKVSKLNDAILIFENKIYTNSNIEVVKVMTMLGAVGQKQFTKKQWASFLEEELLYASRYVQIQFDASLQEEVHDTEPELRLYLKETEKMLSFKPMFSYDNIEKEWLDYSPVIRAHEGKVKVIHRNEATEQTFLTLLRHLHPLMQESRRSHSFLLPSNEALKGGWYFTFIEQLQAAGVKVFGHEQLKQMRINPNRPQTSLRFTSGIDWFEAEMEVEFGDQSATVEAIKKALLKKENFVKLADGTIGLLPEDWMGKYGLMVKMGKTKQNNIQIAKYHFSTIEHLVDEMDNNDELVELIEKQRLIENYDFDSMDGLVLPENIQAELRPYQESGFRWMNFLNETKWGGILADDMGLGKTLQTLTILQYYKNLHQQVKFIVVCPTTLMYNWENEVVKFTPDISYHLYHGSTRRFQSEEFKNADLIITTYGTLRSDIKSLIEINFDYAVLDESQAIKNPISQVAKAASQLHAKNKLALSGTPVQNNTFDLYSQMNFLNPGMLGSSEFFRNEFATPIDKMQDAEAQHQLRKLIYPFLLRRTKEQVAPDLPEKTEMVLFCEMGIKQRKIYDAYRSLYRSKILDEIEDKGVERSHLSILTGLMKLRQICDSPAILKEKEMHDNHSVKIDELIRELTENTGNHKALVFSQFLGMLSLIREELEKLDIPFVYFDGSTSTTEREKAIQQFQNDETCRVFLISLKAGGVGLNLTAADYVYIVDPWWNPAVEQQAIDRTHRIGQTKNIFAYRLICKDTIEEKIMLLQQRKLSLVKNLIADENAFLKRLTKEDVAYLLS